MTFCYGSDPDPRPIPMILYPATDPDPALLFSGMDFKMPTENNIFHKVILFITVHYPQSIYRTWSSKITSNQEVTELNGFLNLFCFFRILEAQKTSGSGILVIGIGFLQARFFSFLQLFPSFCNVWLFKSLFGDSEWIIPGPDPTLQVAPNQILKLGKKTNFKCSY